MDRGTVRNALTIPPINKVMNRADLDGGELVPIVDGLNDLIRELRGRGLATSSWHGSLPERSVWRRWVRRLRQRPPAVRIVGKESRGPDYHPLAGAADDDRIPWYLYWEIAWVLAKGPPLQPGMRVLDAGGTSSLFVCYLASLGYEVHGIDLDPALRRNGERLTRSMGWHMHSYAMHVEALQFADGFFDHAYSLCVFEHLDYDTKQAAIREIARCLKPNGWLCLTFDYRNPAPYVVGLGADRHARNQLSTPDDIGRCFLSTGCFDVVGNADFHDDGSSWLVHPRFAGAPYTFGALFLRKR